MRVFSKIFFFVLLVALGCNSPAPTPAPMFAAIVYYRNLSGDDLLNPSNHGSFSKENVMVYDLISGSGGSEKKAANQSIECDSYVCKSGTSGNYAVEFSFNPMPTYVGTLLKPDPTLSDTLVYQIISASPQSGYSVKQVSFKGQVVWSTDMPRPAVITIIR